MIPLRWILFFPQWILDAAKELEPKYAKTTPVISTASAFRYEDDTPILVGGVNMDHAALAGCAAEEPRLEGLYFSQIQLHHRRSGCFFKTDFG